MKCCFAFDTTCKIVIFTCKFLHFIPEILKIPCAYMPTVNLTCEMSENHPENFSRVKWFFACEKFIFALRDGWPGGSIKCSVTVESQV